MSSQRYSVVPSVYLIPVKNNQTVLGLRKNTPWMNNHYGMISGHVEEGETPEEAIIREAYEEAGIRITPEQLNLSLVMYRQLDRGNIDFFYTATQWDGEIKNCEPDKLGDWEWLNLDSPPANTIHYLTIALQHVAQEKPLQHVNYPSLSIKNTL